MSFLGDLFDPVGAVATGGNNSTFDSIFSPADNLFGNDGLGWEGSTVGDFNQGLANTADDFTDSVWKTNKDELNNLGDHFAKNPGQLFYSGADPFSTKIWNAATNQNNTPFLNTYGGETNADYARSQSKGIDTYGGQIMGTIANMIAGYEAGDYLGDAAGAAAGGTGSTVGSGVNAGADTGMLDGTVAVGTGSNAGFAEDVANAGGDASAWGGGSYGAAGGSAAGAGSSLASYIPSNVAGGATRGAVGSVANALDTDQNPWKAGLRGAASGGLATGLNTAGALGVDDPQYRQVINSTVNGAGGAAINGGRMDNGAAMGLLSGLGRAYGAPVMNWLTGSGGQSAPTTSLPTQDGVNLNQSYYGNQGQSGGMGAAVGNNFGNLMAGLGSLYLSQKAKNAANTQINNLNSLYSPNSPYAQQMQQALDRQDAAAGRRSQYGTRQVELQAKLAQLNSANAPMLNQLQQQKRGIDFGQLGSLYTMGKNFGAFNPSTYQGLGNLYGGQQAQVPTNGAYDMSGQTFNNPSAYTAPQQQDSDNYDFGSF